MISNNEILTPKKKKKNYFKEPMIFISNAVNLFLCTFFTLITESTQILTN